MVERDLKIYADSFNAKCYHYQDYQNREVDSVIELENGEWCAFEIKLGANKIEEGAKNLLKLKEEIQKENGKAPSVLCVICGLSNAVYKKTRWSICCTNYSIKTIIESVIFFGDTFQKQKGVPKSTQKLF